MGVMKRSERRAGLLQGWDVLAALPAAGERSPLLGGGLPRGKSVSAGAVVGGDGGGGGAVGGVWAGLVSGRGLGRRGGVWVCGGVSVRARAVVVGVIGAGWSQARKHGAAVSARGVVAEVRGGGWWG